MVLVFISAVIKKGTPEQYWYLFIYSYHTDPPQKILLVLFYIATIYKEKTKIVFIQAPLL